MDTTEVSEEVADTPDAVALRQAYTTARLLERERQIVDEIEGLQQETDPEGASPAWVPRSPQGSSIELHIAGLGGPLCTVSAERGWSIRKVKSQVASQKSLPVNQQRLFLGTCELADEDILSGFTPPDTPSAELSLVRTDPEWQQAMEMVSRAGMQLAVVDPQLQADRDIVLAAVRQSGRALEYAGEELRADRSIVTAAVQDCGLALEHAVSLLRADREVVLAAVRQSGSALQHAAGPLRADREVVLAAVANSAQAFQHAAESLKADRETVVEIVQEAGLALQFAAKTLRADRDIVVLAVQQDGLALEFASEALRADREVVREAAGALDKNQSHASQFQVQANGLALWDAAESLKRDPELLAVARWG